MADKSAFVPVDLSGHKQTDGNQDVDIDDELFGKKTTPEKKAPAPPAPEKKAPPPAPAPAAPAAASGGGKFQYRKSSTYQKTYAYSKK